MQDMFKERYKYYKAKRKIPDFQEVLQFTDGKNENTSNDAVCELKLCCSDELQFPGLTPTTSWHCYTLRTNPGLILIRNCFTTHGQRYWIARCLRDYPRHPNPVNLQPQLFSPVVLEDWWSALQQCECKEEQRRLKLSMRWTTLGYHHDWNTKIYNEEKRNVFPKDLSELCLHFANALKFHNFKAQAAIVNYYPIGTTLAGHTDHSEVNLQAPLFSISFGQSAIFLIGGKTKEQKPTALFLHSGDVLVMSESARLCYHAVPRVMKSSTETWNELLSDPTTDCTVLEQCHKRLRAENQAATAINYMDMQLFEEVGNELFWSPFNNYLNDARINVNVRQVLNEGNDYLD